MLYWVETGASTKLAIAPRPRGHDWLDTEAKAMRRDGIDILVSLLTPEEEAELALTDEEEACSAAGIEFRNFPIPDRHTPASTQDFRAFVESLHQQTANGKAIAAHCRAGIGRSSLLIASVLTLSGLTAEEAFDRISTARGLQVPDTPEQVAWVRNFSAIS